MPEKLCRSCKARDGGGSTGTGQGPHSFPNRIHYRQKKQTFPHPAVMAQPCVPLHAGTMRHKEIRHLGAHKEMNSHCIKELNI